MFSCYFSFINVAKPTKAPAVHTASMRKFVLQPTMVAGKTEYTPHYTPSKTCFKRGVHPKTKFSLLPVVLFIPPVCVGVSCSVLEIMGCRDVCLVVHLLSLTYKTFVMLISNPCRSCSSHAGFSFQSIRKKRSSEC